jgi:hypothetical protein
MPERFIEPGQHDTGRFPRRTKKFKTKDEDGQTYCPHGMKKAHRYANKWDGGYVGTDISLLKKFLMSRKGKPWDDVYSEICAEADARSFTGHHLREWLDYAVEQHCFLDEEGVVRDQRGMEIGGCRGTFYIHPKTHTLEYVQRPRTHYKRPPKKVFEMDDQLYHEHEDNWYRVQMAEVPMDSRWRYNTWAVLSDVFVAEELNFGRYEYSMIRRLEEEYGHSPNGKPWYCTSKQSANSKEITRLKKQLAA